MPIGTSGPFSSWLTGIQRDIAEPLPPFGKNYVLRVGRFILASTAPYSPNGSVSLARNPIHDILIISAFPLFLGQFSSDWAYSSTGHVQWLNFAAWLNAGALLFAGIALLWAGMRLIKAERRHMSSYRLYVILLASTFVTGFINALVHAKDAWATMPEGLILSSVTLLLMLAVLWTRYGGRLPGMDR